MDRKSRLLKRSVAPAELAGAIGMQRVEGTSNGAEAPAAENLGPGGALPPMTRDFEQAQSERSRFVEDLLSYMTLEEKLGQIALVDLGDGASDPALADAQRANLSRLIRRDAVSAIKGSADRSECAALQARAVEDSRLGIPLLFARDITKCGSDAMPSNLAMAASWDLDALVEYGSRLAASANLHGSNWVHGPNVRLLHPRSAARAADTLGSDPLHAAQIATAICAGMQEAGLSANKSVLACLRCEALENLPTAEAPIAFFRNAAREAERLRLQSASIGGMTSGTVQQLAQRGILKGFAGIAVNEWRAIRAILDDFTDGEEENALPLNAQAARKAMAHGSLTEARIDDAVRRVLGTKFDLGLFRDPFARLDASFAAEREDVMDKVTSTERRISRNSIVLLRNVARLLPLTVDSGDLLVVSGHDGGAHPLREALELRNIPHRHVQGLALGERARANSGLTDSDPLAIGMAADAAKRGGTVLVMLDDRDFTDPEGGHTTLPVPSEATDMLLRSLASANARIIVVLATSRAVAFGALSRQLPCFLLAWQPMPDMVEALADVLTGERSPSGRLPVSVALGDTGPPLPFGFGLGYGEIVYSDFSAELGSDRIVAQTRVRNLGVIGVTETVQLYIRWVDPHGEATPFKYKGARRLRLDAGGSARAQFEIGLNELGDFFEDGEYLVRAGRYEIGVGSHADALEMTEIDLPQGAARAMTFRGNEKPAERRTGTDN